MAPVWVYKRKRGYYNNDSGTGRALLVRFEIDLDFLFGLRSGASVLPFENCLGCAFHKNWIATQGLHFCHVATCEHGDVQANRAANVSVFDDFGIVGFDSPDDLPGTANSVAFIDLPVSPT